MPSAGQADTRAEGAPSVIVEQLAMEVILLPTSERTELLITLVAPSVVGAMLPVEAPLMQAEVGTTVTR